VPFGRPHTLCGLDVQPAKLPLEDPGVSGGRGSSRLYGRRALDRLRPPVRPGGGDSGDVCCRCCRHCGRHGAHGPREGTAFGGGLRLEPPGRGAARADRGEGVLRASATAALGASPCGCSRQRGEPPSPSSAARSWKESEPSTTPAARPVSVTCPRPQTKPFTPPPKQGHDHHNRHVREERVSLGGVRGRGDR